MHKSESFWFLTTQCILLLVFRITEYELLELVDFLLG